MHKQTYNRAMPRGVRKTTTSTPAQPLTPSGPLAGLAKITTTQLLMTLLIVAAFVIGFLVNRVLYLQDQTPAVPTDVSSAFITYAKQLNLDTNKFKTCLSTEKYKNRIDADMKQGQDLGISGTPAFYINGKLIGGAFPEESFKEVIDKELNGSGTTNYKDYSQTLQDAHDDTRGIFFNPIPVGINLGDAPMRGDKNAKVTIVEFSDFQCPYCKQVFPVIQKLMKDYNGKIKLYYKQFPLTSIHPNAYRAAEASECAAEQGKFWEYHDYLFTNQAAWQSLPQGQPDIPLK